MISHRMMNHGYTYGKQIGRRILCRLTRPVVSIRPQQTIMVRHQSSSDASTSPSSSSLQQRPPDLWMEPIHVLGAGSVGLLMAASLRIAFPSYPIRLLLRDHHRLRPHQDRPDVLINLIQNRRLRTVRVPSQIISPAYRPRNKLRNVLVATKSYQVVEALHSIRHCLQLGISSEEEEEEKGGFVTQIVLLCNGAMAARDDVLAHFPDIHPSNLHTALTTHGAYRDLVTSGGESENDSNYYESSSTAEESYPSLMMDVVHAGLGRLDFPPSLADWTPLFDRAGLQAHTLTNDEIEMQLWNKLAANCLINPLTALYHCTNGQVVDCPEWNDYLEKIPNEVAQVSKYNNRLLAETIRIEPCTLRDFCLQVVASTKENRSSMLQDVTAGRRTEIEALNGYVVRLGQANNVPVPANEDLYERISKLSSIGQ